MIFNFLQMFAEKNINDINLIDKKETFTKANTAINYEQFHLPNREQFLQVVNNICEKLENDSFNIYFKVLDKSKLSNTDIESEIAETIKKNTTEEYIKSIYTKIINKEFYKIECSECLRIEIEILKPLDEIKSVHRIYFFEHFLEYLDGLTLKNLLLEKFTKIITSPSSEQIFLIDENIEEFCTYNLFFLHDVKNINNHKKEYIDLVSITDIFKVNGHFITSNINITPYAFYLENQSVNSDVNKFFGKMLTVFTLIFLSNYTELINENKVKIHINGYKLVNPIVDFKKLTIDADIYFEIFRWVFEEKKSTDRLELARNIITLDYQNDLSDINSSTIASIKSNYSIYLKENVERYIELKTRIAGNILDLSLKSRDTIDRFSSNFKNAFVSTMSFIFAVIIINIVGQGNPRDDIFNGDLTVICLIVNAISFGYLVISWFSSKSDFNHYITTFEDIKNMYSGLIVQEDLDKSFNKKILINDKLYFDRQISLYSKLWILTIIISIVGLFFLSLTFKSTTVNGFNAVVNAFVKVNEAFNNH